MVHRAATATTPTTTTLRTSPTIALVPSPLEFRLKITHGHGFAAPDRHHFPPPPPGNPRKKRTKDQRPTVTFRPDHPTLDLKLARDTNSSRYLLHAFLVSTNPRPHHHFADQGIPRQTLGLPLEEATVRKATSHISRVPSPRSPMDRTAPEYSQSGLPSPYPSNFGDTKSEASSVDNASAAPYSSSTPQHEVRPSNYSASGTPTSEYTVYPPSARSASFPEHIQRPYHPASNPNGGTGGMAQTPTSPSMPLQDGRNHHTPQQVKSDSEVPIDPSIAAPSPTYPHGQYPPYPGHQQDMSHSYAHPGSAGLYAQPRPDWSGYSQHPPITPGHPAVFPHTPTTAAGQSRPSQVGCTLTDTRTCAGFLLHFGEKSAIEDRSLAPFENTVTNNWFLLVGLFLCADPRCSAAQAASTSI